MGTQLPLGSRTYPTGHWDMDWPCTWLKLKSGVVVNTAVSIVVANTVAITILLWFNTMCIQSVFICGLGKLYSFYFRVIMIRVSRMQGL